MMKMTLGAIPNPGRVSEQELLSPELGFLVAAELGNFSREIDQVPSVLGQEGLYRRRGNARQWRRGPGDPWLQLTFGLHPGPVWVLCAYFVK